MRLPLAAWGVIWYYGNMSLNATKVAVTRRLPADIEERMGELFDTRFNQTDAVLSRQELGELMANHDVLVPTVADVIDGALIDAAGEQLKLIANFGNGTDNIDVDAAHARGITVTNTPSVLTEDTADMVMALILAVPRVWSRATASSASRAVSGLVADMDAGTASGGQTSGHYRHGAHRPGRGAARACSGWRCFITIVTGFTPIWRLKPAQHMSTVSTVCCAKSILCR